MYRIMIAQAKRDNYETLYKYLTTNIDGEVIPLELGSKEALDKRVEKMLNEEGYAKSDFIIVRVVTIRLTLLHTLTQTLIPILPIST